MLVNSVSKWHHALGTKGCLSVLDAHRDQIRGSIHIYCRLIITSLSVQHFNSKLTPKRSTTLPALKESRANEGSSLDIAWEIRLAQRISFPRARCLPVQLAGQIYDHRGTFVGRGS